MSLRQEETAKTTIPISISFFKNRAKMTRNSRTESQMKELLHIPTSKLEFPSERENINRPLFFYMIFNHIYLKLQKYNHFHYYL